MESDKNKLSRAIRVLSYMISNVSVNRSPEFNTSIDDLFTTAPCEIKEIIYESSGVNVAS